MKAAAYTINGGPEVLEYRDLPDPECADDGILIDVEEISIEGGDLLARAMTPPRNVPHVPGWVAAGIIREVGPSVTDRRVGDRVVTLQRDGSHATRRAVPATLSWPIPLALSTREAVCVPVAFGSAFECLFTAAALQSGETVLVHTGSGGVGMAAIQLAKLAGASVIATASTAERLTRLHDFGMDHGIDYKTEDVAKATLKRTRDRGVDVVIDSVGGHTLAENAALLAWRGRWVHVGTPVHGGANFDADALWARNSSVHGVRLSASLRHEQPRTWQMIAECLARVAAGELRVRIARVFPLEEAAAAHAYIEERKAFGRVVLTTTRRTGQG